MLYPKLFLYLVFLPYKKIQRCTDKVGEKYSKHPD